MPQTHTTRPPLQDVSARTNQSSPQIDLYKARPTAGTDGSVTLNGRVMSVDEAVAEVKKSLGLPAAMTNVQPKYNMPDPLAAPASSSPSSARTAQASTKAAPKTGKKRKSTSTDAGLDEAAANKKRKAEAILAEDIKNFTKTLPGEEDIEDSSYLGEGWGPVDQTCGVVRGKINRLLDNGVMTKTAFCNAINAPPITLNRFLATKGTHGGEGSSIYIKAWKWFKLREDLGIKMPDVKKRKQTIANNAAKATGASHGDGASTSATKFTAKAGSADNNTPDLSSIELDGEEDDEVPIYDSCDEIRKKISAYLKTSNTTQAQFCRDLFDQYRQPPCKSIQSTVLNRFRGGKGPITGTKSTVYYAAYVFFEKLRIAQGKPKSKHREGMEEAWWPHGVDRSVDSSTRYLTMLHDEVATLDEYGRTTIRRNGRVSWQG